jgi:bifunctional enzyme CysN/CysC
LLSAVDAFEKAPSKDDQPFRLPVQDVYKFTARGDDRRITAGRVESGTLRVGDKVVFYPSLKSSTVKSIEAFYGSESAPDRTSIDAGYATGVTLSSQLYGGRGELMARADETPPQVSDRVRANVFWMGRAPLRMGRDYLLKLGTARIHARLEHVNFKIDASESGSDSSADMVERHDVADVVLQLRKPLAFDPTSLLEATGRFVIVDDYEIAGGGIVREGLSDDSRKAADADRAAAGSLWAREAKPGSVIFLAGDEPALDGAADILREKHPVLGPLKPDANLDAFADTLFHVATAGITVFARVEELDSFDVEKLDTRLASVPRRWIRTAAEASAVAKEFGA